MITTFNMETLEVSSFESLLDLALAGLSDSTLIEISYPSGDRGPLVDFDLTSDVRPYLEKFV